MQLDRMRLIAAVSSLLIPLFSYGCGDGVAKTQDGGDDRGADIEDESDPGGDRDTDVDADGDTDSDTDGDTDIDSGALEFPIVYDFDHGMNDFASEYDGWTHDSDKGTVELDCELTGPGVFNFLELDLTTSNWRGVDWTGATVVEYRVKTLESNGGFLQPYLQTDAESWNWFSWAFDYPPTEEWATLALDLTLTPDEIPEGHALDLSGALKLGIQVFGPQEGYFDAAVVEPDASEPLYPEPERVRIALDSIIVRGPEHVVEDDTDTPSDHPADAGS